MKPKNKPSNKTELASLSIELDSLANEKTAADAQDLQRAAFILKTLAQTADDESDKYVKK